MSPPNQKLPQAVMEQSALQKPEPSDEELMLSYQGGDEEAFDRLYDRYHRRIYNFLLHLAGDRARAQDLFQMVFLSLHRHRRRYRPSGRFSSWLFTVARNVARDEFRRSRRRREVALEPAEGASPADRLACQANQVTRIERKEMAERVRGAVQQLPPGQRVVILLSRYGEMSYPEIGKALHISVNAVKQRAFEAMRSLGKILEGGSN